MKRRSFLSLLGIAPAAPLIAKEMAKEAPPVIEQVPEDFRVRYESASQSELTSICMCTLGPTVAVPRKFYRELDPGWSHWEER